MPAIQGLNANTSSVEQVRASAEQNSLSESHKATLQNNNISARAFSTNDAASTALGHTMSPNDPLIRRVTTTANFPEVLYSMIMYCEREGYNDVISFFSHGRAFAIHRPRRFEKEFMPRFFFNMGKIASFHRQLNLYGFKRITEGPDNGGYWHRKFLRGRRDMLVTLKRKSTSKVKRSAQEQEEKNLEEINPLDFPSMPPITPCPDYAGLNEGNPVTNFVHHHANVSAAGVPGLPGTLLTSNLNMNLNLSTRSAAAPETGLFATTAGTGASHLLQVVQRNPPPTTHHRSVQLATGTTVAPGTDFLGASHQSVGASTLLEAQAILEQRELMLRQAEEARNNALANELHSYQQQINGIAGVPRVFKIADNTMSAHQQQQQGGFIAHQQALADFSDLNGLTHRAAPRHHNLNRVINTTTALPQWVTTTHAPAPTARTLTIQETAPSAASYLRDLSSMNQVHTAAAAVQQHQHQQQVSILQHGRHMNIQQIRHQLPPGLVAAAAPVPQQQHIILTNSAATQQPGSPHNNININNGTSALHTQQARAVLTQSAMDSQTRALLNLQASASAPTDVTSQQVGAAQAAASADRAVGRSYFARFAGGRRSL